MTIKAIETQYKGHLFRSRLEARWAVFFDALGIEWVYESEGFVLSDGSRYLPDFYLPRFDRKETGIWVEVKPTAENGATSKAKLFAADANAIVLLAVGLPGTGEFKIAFRPEFYDDGAYDEEAVAFYGRYLPGGKNEDEYRLFFMPDGDPRCPAVQRAVDKAKSARFEHGQSGGML